MSTEDTAADMRREQQHLLSEERELVDQAVNATVRGDYESLRDLADKLVTVAARRAQIRAAIVEARTRGAAGQPQGPASRGPLDQTEDTWRRLR